MKVGLLIVVLTLPLAAQSNQDKLIHASADVLRDMNGSIPQNLMQKAQCVGIVPNEKRAGFIFGGKYGKGVLVCRAANEPHGWSAPEVIRIEGGSWGLQIGAGETDAVFLVMNQSGEQNLMQDKFTIGANAQAMAGPVGRSATAETDAQMHAEILGYSKSRGAFVGLTLNGSTLRPDSGDNKALYGRSTTPGEILHGQVNPPAAAQQLYAELNGYTTPSTGE
ncbi:MAG TPA: lipid-binding SYLF domain-containing protein [Bryobacteraceae bacterium]|jgi:SH3 domain-containing YSC84-like protein 1|nr:lipid-binding SYLF domain-containing protein [Bryobacteraceae bacterium]